MVRRSRAFGNLLRQAAADKGLVQKQVAMKLGLSSPREWRRYLEGKIPRGSILIDKIMEQFGIPGEKIDRAIALGEQEYLTEVFKWHRHPDNRRRLKQVARHYYA